MKTLRVAPCGVVCNLCAAFQRTKNTCVGCSAEGNKPHHCTICRIKDCPEKSGHPERLCVSCEKYPCRRIRDLDKRYRTQYAESPMENMRVIQEKGSEVFDETVMKAWQCTECGELLCVHRNACMNCGAINPHFPPRDSNVGLRANQVRKKMNKPEIVEIGLSGSTAALRCANEDRPLTVLLVAGFGYTLEMPLFYYLERFFSAGNTGLVLADFGYSRDPVFSALPEDEKDRVFESDISKLGVFLEGWKCRELCMVGKSMGTTVCYRLLQRKKLAAKTRKAAWLTPGTSVDEICDAIPHNGLSNILVYGTADAYVKKGHLDALQMAENVKILAVEGGDHSLETGPVDDSILRLHRVIKELTDFFQTEVLTDG